jgi:hypothetical protein
VESWGWTAAFFLSFMTFETDVVTAGVAETTLESSEEMRSDDMVTRQIGHELNAAFHFFSPSCALVLDGIGRRSKTQEELV